MCSIYKIFGSSYFPISCLLFPNYSFQESVLCLYWFGTFIFWFCCISFSQSVSQPAGECITRAELYEDCTLCDHHIGSFTNRGEKDFKKSEAIMDKLRPSKGQAAQGKVIHLVPQESGHVVKWSMREGTNGEKQGATKKSPAPLVDRNRLSPWLHLKV